MNTTKRQGELTENEDVVLRRVVLVVCICSVGPRVSGRGTRLEGLAGQQDLLARPARSQSIKTSRKNAMMEENAWLLTAVASRINKQSKRVLVTKLTARDGFSQYVSE